MKTQTIPFLKPCPMCGGKAAVHHQAGVYSMWIVQVRCTGCAMQTGPFAYGNNGTLAAEECSYEGQEEAIARAAARWNRRVQTAGSENMPIASLKPRSAAIRGREC